MAVVTIGACQGCGACILTCPTSAIQPRGAALIVRREVCTGCGECVEVCPVDVIEMKSAGMDVIEMTSLVAAAR